MKGLKMKISEIKNILSEMRDTYNDGTLNSLISKLVIAYNLPNTVAYKLDLINIFDYWLDNLELEQRNGKSLNKQNLNNIINELYDYNSIRDYLCNHNLEETTTCSGDTLKVLSHIINNMEEIPPSNITIICLHS